MFWTAVAAGIGLILTGAAFWLWARSLRQMTGLPEGRVVYVDTTDDWRPPERPLFSARYALAGKPDYMVETGGRVVPVEVKSGRAPEEPYEGHTLQLGAYCLLVEETTGKKPPYGLIRYADKVFRVEYTGHLKSAVVGTMREIRADMTARDVHRSHDDPARCARCGLRGGCGESLV